MKKFILSAVILSAVCSLFALPEVTPYIPDSSGEYVYYTDSTFTRESYVGFIYYNDETYAARYYSPADPQKQLFEQDITLYVTINTAKNYLELTGEHMTGVTNEADTEIVNYLHDLLYEFSARRKTHFIEDLEDCKVKEDFAQFGGTVYLTFNSLTPVFNLKEITSADGSKLFQLLTAGILTSSQDKSFSNFKGMNTFTPDTSHKFTENKSAEKINIQFKGLNVTLDSQWTQNMENLWQLDDNALLIFSTIDRPAEIDEDLFYGMLLRKIILSTEGSFANHQRMSVSEKNGFTVVKTIYSQPDTKNIVHDFKLLKKIDSTTYICIILTTYENIFESSRSYFNQIITSITGF